MVEKLFGTDGVRGLANSWPMTAEMALKLGAAAGRHFRRDHSNGHRVVIGKDTRLSGYMLENALTAGLTSTGMNVLLLGPVPTPAVGRMTHSMRADLGIMISASHNPFHDNGIKFFGPDGFKLSDEDEAEIERLVHEGVDPVQSQNIGRAKRIEEARQRYMEYLKTTFPQNKRLNGIKVVIDCANGAAYRAAPDALWELGADIIPVGVSPDGTNINKGCGSTDTALAARTVVETGADLGICLDGDADRIMIIDEKGRVADGDQIMALFASHWASEGRLSGGKLVATVMSNLGLERHMAAQGLELLRTKVGDRHVVEAMRAGGYNLGGEQSGHIVMTDYATTGDGLLAGLQFLACMIETGKPASELCQVFETVPQLLKNVRYTLGQTPLEAERVKASIADAEAKLDGKGRLLIRKSGTEPLIRVMAECEDDALLSEVVDGIVAEVEAATA
ncbi:phosphoglucosamine mutase [Aliiroseovarius halocynthiae]|uniref:Phosphoglucosamine mutase n=1 Tax=Aliiroseovarius halocynthiae TaxID=985055 RepID=A0A545SRC7_9RHOB|nr:phosphoglucosamine mutase [Aliiroseovarius halocynthiae]TQV67509.1 phosphoglucosamine mutase [Aliiroseovarius halocynthiae]SMR81519.1 phosphoglucosamine mutase [Aliiroseovarius halocynthiae]